MRTRNLNLTKRVAALEVSLLARPSGGVHVLEKINLPEAERQILKRVVQIGFVITSQEQADAPSHRVRFSIRFSIGA